MYSKDLIFRIKSLVLNAVLISPNSVKSIIQTSSSVNEERDAGLKETRKLEQTTTFYVAKIRQDRLYHWSIGTH